MNNNSENPVNRFKETMNPYRIGLSLIYSRLKWDLSYIGFKSKNKLKKVKNKHKASVKAVIVCNGPSLNSVNLETLTNIYCFGLNKINLLFDRSAFRPSCIVSVNPYVISQNEEFFNKTDIPLYLDGKLRNNIKFRPNVNFLHSTNHFGFARDCSLSVYQGYTVTYVAMQLAFHMGFQEVALIGADHTFKEQGRSNQLIQGGSKDLNHFDEKYFANKEWQLPDYYGMERAYSRAYETYEAFGRKIYNCTNGGSLDIFERIELDEFLNK